jgi:glycosyltransferase involved in cell wall biosynthesis
MRIGIFDNWHEKFSGVLHKHWESMGHTVLFEPGFNPNLVETCDRVFFESADTNSHLASQQRPYKKGKVFVRVVDVDSWVNGPASIKPGYFDGIIYIANHIKERSDEKFRNLDGIPNKVINMGVDLEKFKFRERKKGYKIAFIATRLTEEKGTDEALKIFSELKKRNSQYELHVVGRMFENDLWEKTIEHILLENNIKDSVKFYGNLPYSTGNEINDFLENMDYVLLTSRKEAFSYAIAEGMSKGIKGVCNNFYRAKDIWPSEMIFNTHREAVNMIDCDSYNSGEYRKYIQDNYSLEKHLKEMDEFMEIA